MLACVGSVMVFEAHVRVLKVMPEHVMPSAEIELMHGLQTMVQTIDAWHTNK